MTSITLVLNDAEQQALHQLLDTALRQAGLNALDVVSHFVGRIGAAQSAAQPQRAVNAGTTQVQPAPSPVQTSAAASTAQTHAGQTAPAHPGVASAAAQAAHAATPASGNAAAGAEHQSVLSHLIGEITGSSHAQTSTHPAAAPAPVSAAAHQTQAAAGAVGAPAATAAQGATVPPATSASAPATPATALPAQGATGAPSASS